MEIDIIFAVVAFILGIAISLFSGSVAGLSKEELDDLISNEKLSKEDANRLHILSYDQNIVELFPYTLTVIAIFSIVQFYLHYWWLTLSFSALLFASMFVARSFFFSLGIRLSVDTMKKYIAMPVLIARLNIPFNLMIGFFKEKVGGIQHDEASRDEISALMDSAHEEGSIEAEEYKLLTNIMNFKDIYVSDIMTPRTVVFALEADKTVSEVLAMPEIRNYSRIPIWEGESMDDGIVGYILTKELLFKALSNKKDVTMRQLARRVNFIPENAKIDSALEQLLEKRQQFMMVVDEYGGIDGIITMEDVMETLLGEEIVDEADKVVDLRVLAMQRRDKRIQEKNAIL